MTMKTLAERFEVLEQDYNAVISMVRNFNHSLLTLSSQTSACEGSYSFINNDKIASVIDD